jgi:hypothetical protein
MKQRAKRRSSLAEEESEEGIFNLLAPSASPRRRSGELVLGVVARLEETGEPLVDFPGNSLDGPIRARSTVPITRDQLGRQVALLFEQGDLRAPVIVGLIQQSKTAPEVVVDDERVVLEAEREVVIRCGEASISLTREGRVRIRGTDVLTRASGSNRIKGGSIRIN